MEAGIWMETAYPLTQTLAQRHTRAKRGSKTHEVINYTDAGPLSLWTIQRAVEGAKNALLSNPPSGLTV